MVLNFLHPLSRQTTSKYAEDDDATAVICFKGEDVFAVAFRDVNREGRVQQNAEDVSLNAM